jgi:hypothetical protein
LVAEPYQLDTLVQLPPPLPIHKRPLQWVVRPQGNTVVHIASIQIVEEGTVNEAAVGAQQPHLLAAQLVLLSSIEHLC